VKPDEIPAIEQRAKNGDLSSQLLTAMLYQLGCGTIARDPAKTLMWYREAAGQGNSLALNQVGSYYDTGEGKNPAEAFKWYRMAADHSDAVAEYNVGTLYQHGIGVEKSDEQAAVWYRKAVEHGVELPLMDLVMLYDRGTALPGRSLDENKAEGLAFLRSRSSNGDASAQFALAKVLQAGLLGVPRDNAEAMNWLRKAAEKNPEAQATLGWAYSHGLDVAKDDAEAVTWYRKAAEQGDALGQANLGFMYENGRGVPKDLTEAVKWYRAASEKSEASARYALAKMYEDGRGVPKDRISAIMWFILAKDAGGPDFMRELHPTTAYGSFSFYRHPKKKEFDEAMTRAKAWRDQNYCR